MAAPAISMTFVVLAVVVGALLVGGVVAAVLIATMPKRDRGER